ncbi:hypothetical protein [Salinibius halmophilus]|uniref:hypothetical protein n=1 Tax=Salinibius halmophilus TaxID=1853216 RepID=UPI000E66F04C|nr:hypothetical protein [Salinibius halmophilus]
MKYLFVFLLFLPIYTYSSDTIKIRELYAGDMQFSELAKSLDGKRVKISGYMAPPLKAQADFFVLTKMPMAVCPFCESEADWPDDILFVRGKDTIDVIRYTEPLIVTGILELGTKVDEETGFVSRVRVVNADYERAL